MVETQGQARRISPALSEPESCCRCWPKRWLPIATTCPDCCRGNRASTFSSKARMSSASFTTVLKHCGEVEAFQVRLESRSRCIVRAFHVDSWKGSQRGTYLADLGIVR